MNSIPVVDFKALFETLPGLYLILTPGFTIIAVSDAYLKATMTEREAIVGRGLFDVFPDNPDDKEATGVSNLRTSLNAVLQLGQPHKMAVQKYDIRKPDGVFEERYWSPLNSPVFNEAHELAYIIHNVVDVTDQYKASEKLKKSEKDYQLLVSSVKDHAIFMVDPNGLVASWNSGAENIKGYTAAEIIGKPIAVFYPEEDIKQGVPQSNLRMALQYGHFEAEGWRLKKDGTLFWANIVFTALKDEAGVLYGYSKITRDITERKNAQEKLESLTRQINQSNDAIFISDATPKIKSWNLGAQNLYGFTEAEALGQDPHKLLRTDLKPGELHSLLNEIATKNYWSGELRRKTKAGKDIYVLATVTTLRNDAGAITGYVAVSFDITAQKKLREQVNHLATIVEQSSEAIISRGLDQRMISWNRGAEILLGYSKEDAIGKTAKELGMIRFTNKEIADLEQQVLEKGNWKSEKKYYHKNGSSFFGVVTANAVKNEQGEITSMVFIIKDISLRKQLEDQLKKYNVALELEVKARTEEIIKNESRFRALIENSNDVVSLLDASFKVYYRSPSAFRITGWTDEDMLNTDGTKNVHPDDADKARAIVKELLAKPGKPINCLLRTLHKNGHYLCMEGVVINLLHDADIKAIVFNFRDVTERIEAEEKLAASENFFRALIENSNDIITLMDGSFELLYRSPAAARLTGWTNEDMIGIDATKNIHPEDQPHALEIVREVMANPAITIHSKFRMRHKTGHYLWVEGTLTNLLQDKDVKAIVFNFRDVTARVEAEEKLAASEMRFRLLIENSADGIDLSDEFSNNIYRSPGAIKITGVLPKENQRGFTHPDDAETIKNLQEEFIKKPGIPVPFQARFRHALGHYIWVEGTVTNLLHVAGMQAFVTNFRDITQRKQAEQELKKSFEEKKALAQRMSIILNTLPANIALLDAGGVIIDVNDAWRNFADTNGFIGSNYCIGDNYVDISKNAFGQEKEDGKKVARGIKAVLTNKVKEFVFEYTCDSPKIKRWFRMVITPLQETAYAGAVVMHIDISELRMLEQERLKSKLEEQKKITKAMLIGQERERNHLGQELHDNINQILAGTKMFLGIAVKRNKEVKELIKYPMELLDTSIEEIRMLCHKMVTPLKNVHLEELIRDLLNKFDTATRISTEFTYAVKNGILSDDLQLNIYRIIQELLNNIHKYSGAKKVSITVKANNKVIAITVADDGKGFDPEKKRKGIGISNMMNRVGSFNGEIDIDSSEGNGCKTSITIPY